MAVVRKKQDDKYLKVLRELVTSGSGGNRQCFDCGQKGPTYVNMTIGSFVCTRCSGVLRGLTPPHRVKSISMATFTPDEIEFLKSHGNDTCAKTWLGLWDPKRAVHQDQRELMIDKYERKRYFLEPASPLKSLANAAKLTPSSNSSSTTHSLSSSNNNLSSSNGNIQTMNQKNSALDNSFQNITLTPPSSRSNGNGNINGYGPSAISRPNHQQPQQQNGHHHYDAFSNGLNGFSVTNGNSKSGFNSSAANSETSSCNSNGFTPESEFVADFSSANIFDATSTNSVSSSGSGSSGTNGYAKIQPITAAQLMNGNAGPLMNGNGKIQNGVGGGGGFAPSATNGNGNSENFADFDHAPIFNAAGLPISNSTASNSFSSSATFNSTSSFSSSPAMDRYAALKDLDEQLRESKAVAAAAAAAVATSVVDSFGVANNNSSNANPFKTVVNSQQTPQIANPFQANSSLNPIATSLFGGMPQNQQQNGLTNGYGMPVPQHQQQQQQQHQQLLHNHHQQHQQQQQQQAFYNYTNGFGAPTTNMYSSGPNGCGFGFGTMQQPIATGGGASFNNPFAATGTLNSNNPFL